ncbi:glycoside hydrolase family 99-like domain-containing protein, partial [Priestia megaterium]|uniref:glycosyltransferase WbsX family protein n=1 Tax=Priestia megaterium TaxID=1404 RepID=UPI003009F553
FYLPQYHAIPENDEWWGEGFTEWTNVKKSEPLYKNHNQPRVPLKENYYNLLDENVQEWQSNLAQQYGIEAFCYYHYWFNGKKLLEKPLENMLTNKNVTIPFCFCWANEPWTRAWDGKTKDVLMPQEYGHKEEWKHHIEYLLKFFKDERYIKINNKPVFVIYRLSSINNSRQMLELWEEELKKHGFDGIYLISMLTSFDNSKANNDLVSALVEFEPMFTVRHELPLAKQGVRVIKKKFNKKINAPFTLDRLDYGYVWKKIINRQSLQKIYNKKTYLGAFVGWDNSPRKNRNALIMENMDKEIFRESLGIQLDKSIELENDFLFINAWNEWAEGTYLEPDTINKYDFLEIIKNELIKRKLLKKD